MEIHEFVDEGLGHSSHLVCVDGRALVIDPPRFPTAIDDRAGQVGVEIVWTADTHSHAVPGSRANTLRPVFASWAGWLIDPEQELVVVVDPDQDRDDLVRQCLDVGLENLLGELDGGIEAWTTSGRETSQIPIVDHTSVADTVIDVRQADDYAAGHLPDAVNTKLDAITETAIPDDQITMMCGHGERAMTAASLVATRSGLTVTVFDGGPDTWAAATGNDLETNS